MAGLLDGHAQTGVNGKPFYAEYTDDVRYLYMQEFMTEGGEPYTYGSWVRACGPTPG